MHTQAYRNTIIHIHIHMHVHICDSIQLITFQPLTQIDAEFEMSSKCFWLLSHNKLVRIQKRSQFIEFSFPSNILIHFMR